MDKIIVILILRALYPFFKIRTLNLYRIGIVQSHKTGTVLIVIGINSIEIDFNGDIFRLFFLYSIFNRGGLRYDIFCILYKSTFYG